MWRQVIGMSNCRKGNWRTCCLRSRIQSIGRQKAIRIVAWWKSLWWCRTIQNRSESFWSPPRAHCPSAMRGRPCHSCPVIYRCWFRSVSLKIFWFFQKDTSPIDSTKSKTSSGCFSKSLSVNFRKFIATFLNRNALFIQKFSPFLGR